MTNENDIWLPEPQTTDNTWARRGEHTLDWLARSTLPRAQSCRRFLKQNIAALPLEHQPLFRHALRERWKSTFFELIVIRTIQMLGALITIELATSSGKRPDIRAQFQDGNVTIEAIAPVFNAQVGEIVKNYSPLIEIIEANIPEGWSIAILNLPRLGPDDSRKHFKQAVEKLLILPPIQESTQPQDITYKLPQGVIHLHAIPSHVNSQRAIIEPGVGFTDNTVARIEHAIRKKRTQVRHSGAPVLLAIEASGLASELEDFDIALFGHQSGRFVPGHGIVEAGFVPNGIFTRSRSATPTYAGVLAFLKVGFRAGPDPVLFLNPRFTDKLPTQLLKLDLHIYKPDKGIQVRSSEITGFRDNLGFVQE
jgi:hypothetical protein